MATAAAANEHPKEQQDEQLCNNNDADPPNTVDNFFTFSDNNFTFDVAADDEKRGGKEKGNSNISSSSSSTGRCRPCCSIPGGFMALKAAIFATLALAMSFVATNSCNFVHSEIEYCAPVSDDPPPPHYACCGDCYCIKDESSNYQCPDRVPNMNITQDTLQQFHSLELVNPMNLTCNPYDTQYTGIPCETSPPQDYTELGDEAVCGVIYENNNNNNNTLNDNDQEQCPTRYRLQSYPSIDAMKADTSNNAVLTHWGSCGVCSTLQDLAVYVENTDLTTLGVQCSISGVLEYERGVRCYQRAGYTRACSEMWVYNGLQTRDFCGGTCVKFRSQKRPNNGPTPQCLLDECLQCDEDNAGPLFVKVAARSRRRSGLLSKIARPCNEILFVDHQNPCDVVQGVTIEYTQSNVCEQADPNYDPTPQCVYFEGGVGLFSHSTITTSPGLFNFNLDLFRDASDELLTTYYNVCTRYSTGRTQSGFWDDVATNVLGVPWKVAKAFGIIALVVGSVIVICLWSVTACVAVKPRFWHTMGGFGMFLGSCNLFTLVFLRSSICTTRGCRFGYAAAMAILAGVFWFVAGSLSFVAAVQNKSRHNTVTKTIVEIQEYVASDGEIITETTTIRSNGTTMIERTVRKPPVGPAIPTSNNTVLDANSDPEDGDANVEDRPLLNSSAKTDPLS